MNQFKKARPMLDEVTVSTVCKTEIHRKADSGKSANIKLEKDG